MTNNLSTQEQAVVDRIILANQQMATAQNDANGGPASLGRAQHRKHHGCVTARFVVARDVPADLQAGIFALPAGTEFRALVRFSNGRTRDDNEPDAHGMAIKLLDVEGARAVDQAWQTSQDFVLVDDELFFSGDLTTYEVINSAIAKGTGSPLAGLVPTWLARLIMERKLGPDADRTVAALVDFAGQKPVSPLASHYWSTTPYRLGTKYVKYMAYSARAYQERAGDIGPDHYSEMLRQELRKEPATFDFLVHVQEDELNHPIEKPEVSWSRNGARAFKLATLDIETQDIDRGADLADRVVFSPWNCLLAHEPVGKINLSRRDVYAKLAAQRQPASADDWRIWSNVPAHCRI